MDIVVNSSTVVETVINKNTVSRFNNLWEIILKYFEGKRKYHPIDDRKVLVKTVRQNFRIVADMQIVKIVNKDVLKEEKGKTLVKKVEGYFDSLNNRSFSYEYGWFSYENTSAKSVVHHGFNSLKGISLGAVDDVLKKGRVISYKRKYKGKNNDRMLIAAPIRINFGHNKGDYIMGVSIDVSLNSNRVELIEVALEKGESPNGFNTNVYPAVNCDSPSVLTLLQQVVEVKNGTRDLNHVIAIGIDSK